MFYKRLFGLLKKELLFLAELWSTASRANTKYSGGGALLDWSMAVRPP
jgi:hypothetical protein